MIIQRIKRWLQEAFAWWPWKQGSETSYTAAGSSMNKGVTQESILWTTTKRSMPPSSITSVAIEHADSEAPSETSSSAIEERPERNVQFRSSIEERHDTFLHSRAETLATTQETPAPTYEQRLEFVRYLVKRGLVNEGFKEGQVPEQYRSR